MLCRIANSFLRSTPINRSLQLVAYLRRYKLKANNVILAGEEHKDLCNELVQRYPVEYTAGELDFPVVSSP